MNELIEFFSSPLKIGNLQLPRFLGGPLDGAVDEPFRKIIRMFCPKSLLYTQIRHIACVVKAPRDKIVVDQATRPINFQVTASSIDYVVQACEIIKELGVDAVDLNSGCPARNCIKNGAGSALMADPKKFEKILTLLRTNLTCPLTVKMRAGFKEHNAYEIARCAVDCGVDALAIHPRLQTQRFSGLPDYSMVATIKKSCNIPVLISGGVRDIESARSIFLATHIDGFLIGRAQLGCPWILAMLRHQSLGEHYYLDQSVILTAISKHMSLLEAYYGTAGLPLAARHIGWYISGRDNASAMRSQLQACNSWPELHEKMAVVLRS